VLRHLPPSSSLSPHRTSPISASEQIADPPDTVIKDEAQDPFQDGAHPNVRRNFGILALYQVVVRLGWIFKTESIVMPAVLDSIGGSATLRGMLPMLNRLSVAIPPVFLAHRIREAPQKKIALAIFTALMGICFLLLAWIWTIHAPSIRNHLTSIFLLVYALFFVASGMSHLTFGTLQGKIMPAKLRGRLMLVSTVVGVACAIAAVAWLLPGWLHSEGGDFHLIFGFTGTCFLVSAAIALLILEVPSRQSRDDPGTTGVRGIWNALRGDRNLRLTALVSTLANCSILLFPHYQALGRDRLGLDFTVIVTWVILQNIGTALFSSIAGSVADWRGNRLVLRTIILALCLIPPLALIVCRSQQSGPSAFGCVFFLIGITPVFLRIVQHYTLEICEIENHSRYLATVTLCSALPFVFSPCVGYAVDILGFDVVFLTVSMLVFLAFVLSFRLVEPRHAD